MKAYSIYFNAPGVNGSTTLICKENDSAILSMLAKKYDCKEEHMKIEQVSEVNLEEINIKNLDARSFLNLMKIGILEG
jgi:hypothetical protein